jgi:hypothetical protein
LQILLTLLIWQQLGGEPQVARLPFENIKDCITAAQTFLESPTATAAAASAAGCTVKRGQPA